VEAAGGTDAAPPPRSIGESGAPKRLQMRRHRVSGETSRDHRRARLRGARQRIDLHPGRIPEAAVKTGSEPLLAIEVQRGGYLDQEDIVRIDDY
jgi:hypothetical protein